jgi:hypothetical protein
MANARSSRSGVVIGVDALGGFVVSLAAVLRAPPFAAALRLFAAFRGFFGAVERLATGVSGHDTVEMTAPRGGGRIRWAGNAGGLELRSRKAGSLRREARDFGFAVLARLREPGGRGREATRLRTVCMAVTLNTGTYNLGTLNTGSLPQDDPTSRIRRESGE